jgi:serine/threonine-protein kinase RsbW
MEKFLHSPVTTLDILKHSRYDTQTDLKALKAILAWFDDFHDATTIPQDVWLQCKLALVEGFTNVVRHAHQGLPPETPIAIEIIVSTAYLDIKIWDQGPGFDYQAMLTRKLQTTTPESEGGRGLQILSRVADSVEYTRIDDQQNCLHMRKFFSQL